MGAYGPLLLAPAEGLWGPSGPLPSGGNLFLIINEKIQENPLTFDWSMVLSKSGLRDPLNPIFLFQKKYCVSTKKLFVSIDHHAKYKIFK